MIEPVKFSTTPNEQGLGKELLTASDERTQEVCKERFESLTNDLVGIQDLLLKSD